MHIAKRAQPLAKPLHRMAQPRSVLDTVLVAAIVIAAVQ